jgi:hypothetical protein
LPCWAFKRYPPGPEGAIRKEARIDKGCVRHGSETEQDVIELGRLEADGEEDDLLIGILLGDLDGVEGGVHHPYITACRPYGEEVAA